MQRKRECHDRAVDTLQASSRHLEPQRSIVVFHCIATREAAYSNHIQVSTTTITTTSRHCLCAQSLDCCISRFIETKYIWPFYKLNNTFPLSPSLSLCISFCIYLYLTLPQKRRRHIESLYTHTVTVFIVCYSVYILFIKKNFFSEVITILQFQ